MKHLCISLFVFTVLAGCAQHQPIQPLSEPPRAAVIIPPPQTTTAGSLWTERQGSLFYDNKARQIGDILTVTINEAASASKEATTETGRTSSMSAGISTLFGIERKIADITGNDSSNLVSANTTNSFTGSGEITRKEDLVATLTTQVVEVLPNGNLRIEGTKTVTVNHETQLVRLTGIVRPANISATNLVDSKFILDARIDYSGKGIISDKQRPGWLVRLLDTVSPF